MKTLLASCSLVVLLAACMDQPTTPDAAPGVTPRMSTAAVGTTEDTLTAVAGGGAADTDRDGTGDEASADAAVFSALNDNLNGRWYLHWEWSIAGRAPVTSAKVRLATLRGNLSNQPTDLYAATADGDGALTAADFGTQVTPLGVAMPVPDGWEQGAFEFDVTDALNEAIAAGREYLVLQGRLPDGATGGGVQVYSTAEFNSTSVQPKLIVVQPVNDPPTIGTPPSAASGVEGSTVRFSTQATDPEGATVAYTWSFGDGTTDSGNSVSHVYADNGTYTVTVIASDGARADTARTTATITNAAPVTTAPATATAAPRTAYTLQASFTDAGAQDGPWAYTVSWGDGSAPSARTQAAQGAIAVSHTYKKTGTYTVAITVTDKDGASGAATTLVTVARTKGRR